MNEDMLKDHSVTFQCQRLTCDKQLHSINNVIHHLDRCDVELTCAGYYALNKSFILTLIGMCFTYAIILIQSH